jgi:phage FluMu protein Com
MVPTLFAIQAIVALDETRRALKSLLNEFVPSTTGILFPSYFFYSIEEAISFVEQEVKVRRQIELAIECPECKTALKGKLLQTGRCPNCRNILARISHTGN